MRRLCASALFAVALAACGGGADLGVRRADQVPAPVVIRDPAVLRTADAPAVRSKLEAALARDPDDVGALSDLAMTWFAEERRDAARVLLDEALARGAPREQQVALVNLAALYADEGYLEAAMAYAQTAHDIDPARPEPAYLLAVLASARGERERAREHARDALRLDDAAGSAREKLAVLHPEARLHLDAVLAEATASPDAASRWRELRAARFPALAAVAERRLEGR
jgi:tetratricopeptide (TPR) repeat protein